MKYAENRYSVQLPPESSFLSGATFYNSHIIKASMAPPLANETACQNAGDALGGCIPTAASALMNVTSGRTPRRNNGAGPGGSALILARFFHLHHRWWTSSRWAHRTHFTIRTANEHDGNYEREADERFGKWINHFTSRLSWNVQQLTGGLLIL